MKTLKLKKINLRKADGSKHPDISGRKTYLVNYHGAQIIGKFHRVWFGWTFSWFWGANTLQLDSFKEIYEVIP